MTCKNCDNEPQEEDGFCRQCGEELGSDSMTCECGAEVEQNDNFCHSCGSAFSGEIEEADDHDEEEGDHNDDETEEEAPQPDSSTF